MSDYPPNTILSDNGAKETTLLHFNKARQELALATSIDEVKSIRDKAEAFRLYAKQARFSLEMQNWCAEIKIRAERRAGEILHNMEKHRPGPVPLRDRSYEATEPPRLKELGISKSQSSRWQMIAAIPDAAFEERLESLRRNSKELTSSEMVSFGAYLKREREREERRVSAADVAASVSPNDRVIVKLGDFRVVLNDLPDDSVDLILSDLPYAEEYIELFGDLARFASRVLKPGKLLACYTGHFHLPAVIRQLKSSLNYVWTAAIFCTYADTHFPVRIKGLWKPVLLFSKGKYEPVGWLTDVLPGIRKEKELHPWQQSSEDAVHLISSLTYPGDLVVDPCLGVGSTAVAASSLNRRFIGCDIDPYCVNETLRRLAAD